MSDDPWFETSAVDRYLYHFTSIDSLASIALSGELMLSPVSVMNDPAESRSRGASAIVRVGMERGDATASDQEDALRRTEELHRRVKILCFSRDSIDDTGAPHGAVSNAAMWAHCTKSHTGACLVLDRLALQGVVDATLPEARSQAVSYKSPPIDEIARGHVVNDHGNLTQPGDEEMIGAYFWRSTDWEYECEFRIVCLSEEDLAVPVQGVVAGIAVRTGFEQHRLRTARAAAEALQVTATEVRRVVASTDGGLGTTSLA